jgi:hypothetical protein
MAQHRWVGYVAVAAVAAGARLVQEKVAYGIYIDELTYGEIATSLATGHGLTSYGVPFNLHPPAVFALIAVVISIFSIHGNLADVVLTLRPLFGVVGVAECVVFYGLAGSVVCKRMAFFTALLLALDPFTILFDSRVMLEAPTQLGALCCITALVAAVKHSVPRKAGHLSIIAGFFAAITVTSKETFGLVLMVALVLMWVTQWAGARRLIARTIIGAVIGYVLYILAIAINGTLSPWVTEKTSGVKRLLGIEQSTGFNSPTVHVTFLGRLEADLGQFATTYFLLAVGALCTVLAFRIIKPWRAKRRAACCPEDCAIMVVALWALCAAAYLGFAVVIGTLEEQMFYIMFAPMVLMVFVVLERRRDLFAVGNGKALALFLVILLAVDSGVWVNIHTRHDTTYTQLLTWTSRHLPKNTVVAVDEYSAQFILSGFDIGEWDTPQSWLRQHVQYVLVSTLLDNQRYSGVSPKTARALALGFPVAWSASGTSVGKLVLYDVRGFTHNYSS